MPTPDADALPVRPRAIALDAMGVIYPVADDLRDLLIPYLRSKGSTVPDETIIEAYRACYRRGAPARDLWALSGCDWQDGALERDFLALYTLRPGVIEFLEAMEQHEIPVFGLSNDVADWAAPRRHLLGIERYFQSWVVSGELRVVKPQPAIYQRLLEQLPCPPADCLFVDDRIDNLTAAAASGLALVWFSEEASPELPSVSSFEALTHLVTGAL